MVTLTLRALAGLRGRSDIASVANTDKSAAPPASKKMTSQALSPAQARLRQSYRNLALWTFQGWLSMFFLAAGWAKVSEPLPTLVELMSWPALVPLEMTQGLGMAEMVLALFLLAPLVSWKWGRPLLVTAAAGLLALQVVMLGVHALGGDLGPTVTNLVLIAMTAPVLWLRAREVR